jgi:deazaflavin-dependent oxidoreductase (nitroreductase family)
MAERYIRWVPGERAMRWTSRIHTALYRATRGAIGARADGLDMLLLTTRGRKSGRARTNPLPYFRDGGDLVVIASFGGNDRHPAWYQNLVRDPKVRVRVRGSAGEFEAHPANGASRARLWAEITAGQPRFLDYQRRTAREIPVVVLAGAASLV